jgi:two-component system response regulator AtoC
LRRVGSAVDTPVDVRILATTSKDPNAFLSSSPLAPRFLASQLPVPPLRSRSDDLPGMCNRLLARCAARGGRPARAFGPEAIARLLTYSWPGNVAELATVIERAALICGEAVVGPDFIALDDRVRAGGPGAEKASTPIDLPGQLDHLERRELYAALERCGGNKAEVARMLGIQRTTLYYRLKKLGIEV